MFINFLPNNGFAQESAGGQDQSSEDSYFDRLNEYKVMMDFEPNDTTEDGIAKNVARWQWFWDKRMGSGTESNNGKFSNYIGAVNKILELGPFCQNNSENQLNWDLLGPISQDKHRQGRVDIVLADPQNPNIVYAGTVSSGLWRCSDISVDTPIWTNITDHLSMPSMGVIGIDIDPTNSNIGYVSLGYRNGINSYNSLSIGLFKTNNLLDALPVWEKLLPEDNTDITSKISQVLIDKTSPQKVYAVINNKLLISEDWGNTFNLLVDFGSDENNPGYKLRITDLIIDKYDTDVLFIVGDYKENEGDDIRKAIFWKYTLVEGEENLLENQIDKMYNDISISPFYTSIQLDEGQHGIYALYFYYENGDRKNMVKKTSDSGENWNIFAEFNNINTNAIFDVSNENDNVFYLEGAKSSTTIPPVQFYRILIKTTDRGNSFITGTVYNHESDYHGVGTHADIRGFSLIEGSNDGLGDKILCASDGGVLYSTMAFDDYIVWKDINGEGLAITMFYGMGQQYDDKNKYGGGSQDNGILVFDLDNKWKNVKGGDGYELLFNKIDPRYVLSENNGGGF